VNLRIMDPSETPGRRFDAQLAELIQAREEGLIDGIGLSNVSRAQLMRAVAQTEIVCVCDNDVVDHQVVVRKRMTPHTGRAPPR
jgi:diketogulonate reductase-like aldo/keto reductase